MCERQLFVAGDRVQKAGGDYRFVGTVVAAFTKRSGKMRYVVENDDGILHIFNGRDLEFRSEVREQ